MLTPEDNNLLTRIEGDAPMGQMMRRYWIAACLTEEIDEPDCDPVRVRLFGEDLVAFRDSEGRPGLIDEACPHRRASLFYGRNEECGLRCLYHGWKFDVEGNCVDMSSEPAGSGLTEKMKIKSYPVKEWGGFIWTYMGPAAAMPEFLPPHFAPTEKTNIAIFKVVINTNWAQGLEGAIDSAHSSSLHSTDMPPAAVNSSTATGTSWQRPSTDKSPRLIAQSTNYGFQYAAVRKPIRNSDSHDYVRLTHFIAPHHVAIPPNNVYNVAQMNVPIDDAHHNLYIMAWSETGGVSTEAWRKFTGTQLGIDLDPTYRKINNRQNNFGQDRAAMRVGNNFTGIRGFPNQDIAMWETMEPIAERWKEKLGASDLAVVEFRRRMVEAVKAFINGAEPPQLNDAQRGRVRAYEGIVPKSTDWRTLGGAEEKQDAAAE